MEIGARFLILMLKRAFDIIASTAASIILAPLFLLLAISIKLDSPGPVFYRARRVGKDARPFYMLKFRTMVKNADQLGSKITEKYDSRITCSGRWLRFFKLDELPQIWNVFVGDMSIVGPRPEEIDVMKRYPEQQKRILKVKPGLTCMAQVVFFPDIIYWETIPKGVDLQEYYLEYLLPKKLEPDLDYIERQSLWLDLEIIFKTIWCVLIKSWWLFLVKRQRTQAP